MRRIGAIMFVLAALFCASADACPMCKDSIPSSDAQAASALPGGFNNSVYLLLISVFTVAATMILFIVRTIRQSSARPAFHVIEKRDRR